MPEPRGLKVEAKLTNEEFRRCQQLAGRRGVTIATLLRLLLAEEWSRLSTSTAALPYGDHQVFDAIDPRTGALVLGCECPACTNARRSRSLARLDSPKRASS